MLDERGDQQVATRASAFGIPPERSAWAPSMIDDPIQYWVRIIRGEYLRRTPEGAFVRDHQRRY